MTISTKFNPLGSTGGGGTDAYIQDGLVLHLDGINDGGIPGVWKDLSPEGNDMILKNAIRCERGYDFRVAGCDNRCLKRTNADAHNSTLESVMECDTNIPVFNDVWSMMAFGYVAGVANSGNDSVELWNRHIRTQLTRVGYETGVDYNVNNNLQGQCLFKLPRWGYYTVGGWGNGQPGGGMAYTLRVYNRQLTPEERTHNYELDKMRYDLQDQYHLETGAASSIGNQIIQAYAYNKAVYTSETPWITVRNNALDIEANTTGAVRRGRVKIDCYLQLQDGAFEHKTWQYMTIRQSA